MAAEMTPAQVPAVLVELGVEASDDYTDHSYESWTNAGHVRAVLARVLPAYAAMVREEAARDVARVGASFSPHHLARPYVDAFAAIARGETPTLPKETR